MLNKDSVHKILCEAGINIKKSDILSIIEHSESTYNYVYRIKTNNEDYILKKANKKLKSEIFSTVNLNHIKRLETDYNVSCIFRRILGTEIIPMIYFYKKEKPTILMHAFKGHILKEDLLKGIINPKIFIKIGKIIGKIHSSTYKVFNQSNYLFENSDNREEELKTHYFAIADNVKKNLSKEILELANLHRKRKLCIIHGDLTSKNIIVDKCNIHLIDFELSHIGSPEYDIGHFLPEYFLASIGSGKNCLNLDEFFSSYFSEFTNLNNFEKNEIKINSLKHSAIIMLFRLGGIAKTDFLDSNSRNKLYNFIKKTLESNKLKKGIDNNFIKECIDVIKFSSF